MRFQRTASGGNSRRGLTLIEISISFGVLATVLAAIINMAAQDSKVASSTMGIGLSEMKAQQMLRRIETELANARGEAPVASLTETITVGESNEIEVDSTLGFPPSGTLLLQRGTVSEERIDYENLTVSQDHFMGLERGQQCTEAASHEAGVGDTLMWAAHAESIELQVNPPQSAWDGLAEVPGGTLFFRGDGTGFSYRVPIDPSGANPPNYLTGNELTWGHSIRGNPNAQNWACLYYDPQFVIEESEVFQDLNGDGDELDSFDVGRIRRRIWNWAVPGAPVDDLALGPTNILQERCNWGGDLDSSGFENPIFLWDEASRQLHLQLLILGYSAADSPITRRVNSTVFLRNQPEN